MPIITGTDVEVTWERGAAADGNTATLQVTYPDGTVVDLDPTESGGTFTDTVTTELAGRYVLLWTDSTAEVTHVDTLEVWPEDPRYLISFDDAAKSLQWRDSDRAENGDMLRLYIAAATPIIEDIAGAVLARTITQPADGGKTGIALWERPEEVTSVTIDGAEYTGFVSNLNAAIVYYDRHGSRFPSGRQIVTVTYTTGASQIAPNIQLGTRELVRHLWQIGQQAVEGGFTEYGQTPMGRTPSGFAVPKRVIELVSPSYSLPGTA